MLAIAVARSKGKGWIVPTRAMERSNQDLMAPAVATARESKGKGGSNKIIDDRSKKLSQSIHFRGANFASFLYTHHFSCPLQTRTVQYIGMLRNWLHFKYPEKMAKSNHGRRVKGGKRKQKRATVSTTGVGQPESQILQPIDTN